MNRCDIIKGMIMQKSLFLIFCFLTPFFVFAGNIDPDDVGNKYAELIGDGTSINFDCEDCSVIVTDSEITGFAWSQAFGWINFDTEGASVQNDGEGNLSGYAWSNQAGWINFSPGGVSVSIDEDGFFDGYAWNQNYGWIFFDCSTPGEVPCVETSWRAAVEETPVVDDGSTGSGFIPEVDDSINIDLEDNAVGPDDEVVVEAPVLTEELPLPNIVEEDIVFFENQDNPFVDVQETAGVSVEEVESEIVSEKGNGTKKVLATVALLGIILKLLTPFSELPLHLSEFVQKLNRLFAGILFKKKHRPWGTVYDSKTKEPLDPVYVSLIDKSGKEVSSTITDLDGRYSFLVDPGTYKLQVSKTHYTFPSQNSKNNTRDVIYENLYFGDWFTVQNKEDVILFDIPMDPVDFSWNEFEKKRTHIMSFYSHFYVWYVKVANLLFWVGFPFSLYALIRTPNILNFVIFFVYVIFIFLSKYSNIYNVSKGFVKLSDNTPAAGYLVKVISAQMNREVKKTITNKNGLYFALIPKGQYFLQIENFNKDGVSEVVHSTEPKKYKKGCVDDIITLS